MSVTNNKLKVLLLTSKFGMGHYSAAKNLAEQIIGSNLPIEIIFADICEIAFPKQSQNFYKIYGTITFRCGKLFNQAYKKAVSSNEDTLNKVIFFEDFVLKKLSKYIDSACPDVIITTYSLAAKFLSDYKNNTGSKIPVVTCVTDISVHNVWTNSNTALYLVASDESKSGLISRGVYAEDIAICGIPVAAEYKNILKDSQPKKHKELLLMGGGLGLLPKKMSFYRKLDRLPCTHTTIICGRNKTLLRKLQKENFSSIEVLGFCSNVPDYLHKADVLISKPGGISTFEAIQAEVPFLAFAPFMEQEMMNGNYINNHHLGTVLPSDLDQALDMIGSIIADDQLLISYKYSMKQTKEQFQSEALINFLRTCQNSYEEVNSTCAHDNYCSFGLCNGGVA